MQTFRRFLLTEIVCGLALASAGLLAGCGDSGHSGEPATVKDAPPMTPEQQKGFDANYKTGKK